MPEPVWFVLALSLAANVFLLGACAALRKACRSYRDMAIKAALELRLERTGE